MQRLVALALEYRFLVVLAPLLVVVLGVFSLQRLPIEGVPDITPNQVLVLTKAPSLSPPEIEKYISFPVEWSMSGLPGLSNMELRSILDWDIAPKLRSVPGIVEVTSHGEELKTDQHQGEHLVWPTI